MQINHNYISFHSERYTDGDPVYHGQFFQIRQTQACSYSRHRFGKSVFLFYVPAVRIVSGYPVFSTSAVSAFSSRKVFLSSPDIRKQSHLPYFLMHRKRFPWQSFYQVLYLDVFICPSSLHLAGSMLSLKSSDPSQHTVHPVFVTGKIDKLSSQDSSVWTHDGTDRIRIDAEIHTADRLFFDRCFF